MVREIKDNIKMFDWAGQLQEKRFLVRVIWGLEISRTTETEIPQYKYFIELLQEQNIRNVKR